MERNAGRRLGGALTLTLCLSLAGCATCSDPRGGVIFSPRVDGESPDMALFRLQVAGAIASELAYPVEACRANETGVAQVDLRIDRRNGALLGVEPADSSGHPRLDDELVRAWRAVQARGMRFTLPPSLAGSDGVLMYRAAMRFSGR